MIIPSLTTFTVGQKLTAALLNSNVRDLGTFMLGTPLCVLTATALQNIPNAASTAVAWDTEQIDSDGMFNVAVNTTRIVAQTAGWYQVSGTVQFGANSTGDRSVGFVINGGANIIANVEVQANATQRTSLTTGTALFLNAGDFLQVVCWQTTGGTFPTIGTGSRVSVQWCHS